MCTQVFMLMTPPIVFPRWTLLSGVPFRFHTACGTRSPQWSRMFSLTHHTPDIDVVWALCWDTLLVARRLCAKKVILYEPHYMWRHLHPFCPQWKQPTEPIHNSLMHTTWPSRTGRGNTDILLYPRRLSMMLMAHWLWTNQSTRQVLHISLWGTTTTSLQTWKYTITDLYPYVRYGHCQSVIKSSTTFNQRSTKQWHAWYLLEIRDKCFESSSTTISAFAVTTTAVATKIRATITTMTAVATTTADLPATIMATVTTIIVVAITTVPAVTTIKAVVATIMAAVTTICCCCNNNSIFCNDGCRYKNNRLQNLYMNYCFKFSQMDKLPTHHTQIGTFLYQNPQYKAKSQN